VLSLPSADMRGAQPSAPRVEDSLQARGLKGLLVIELRRASREADCTLPRVHAFCRGPGGYVAEDEVLPSPNRSTELPLNWDYPSGTLKK